MKKSTYEELKKFFMNDRVAMNFGCEILEADNAHAVVSIDVDERHYNANNSVQGGVMFTMADFACALVANADEIAFVSVDGNISYLCAATGKKLIAEAKLIRRGKNLVFCEAFLRDENNRNVARANFTMSRVKQ